MSTEQAVAYLALSLLVAIVVRVVVEAGRHGRGMQYAEAAVVAALVLIAAWLGGTGALS